MRRGASHLRPHRASKWPDPAAQQGDPFTPLHRAVLVKRKAVPASAALKATAHRTKDSAAIRRSHRTPAGFPLPSWGKRGLIPFVSNPSCAPLPRRHRANPHDFQTRAGRLRRSTASSLSSIPPVAIQRAAKTPIPQTVQTMSRLLAAFVFLSSILGSVGATAQTITGAGSSAAAPIYRSWAKAYARATGATVEYDPVGSSGGIKKIRQNEVGFGASDVAPSSKELAEGGLVTFPVAITGIAPVFNLAKISDGQLRLTSEVLARIFLGEVTRWNAPEIAAINPGVALPNEAIKVIVRSDGSGTTYNFTDYLGKVSPKWKTTYGARNSIKWADGFIGAKGSDGVVQAVKDTQGSIAYIDHGYVKEHGLATAQLKNVDGEFVRPSVAAFRAALASSEWATAGSFSQTLTPATRQSRVAHHHGHFCRRAPGGQQS